MNTKKIKKLKKGISRSNYQIWNKIFVNVSVNVINKKISKDLTNKVRCQRQQTTLNNNQKRKNWLNCEWWYIDKILTS